MIFHAAVTIFSVLDTRQYRDANFAEDSDAHPKTMLGAAQLAWLKQALLASDATWKVIVSSVPMSVPTGFPPANGRDGWANFDQTTGYEHELLGILRFMQSNGIRNTLWITTDVHFSEAFRYAPFADDPAFAVYELVTGPMNSGIFPTTDFDTTLNTERIGFFAPPSPAAVTSWAEAKHWFNFGEVQVAGDGALTVRENAVAATLTAQTSRPIGHGGGLALRSEPGVTRLDHAREIVGLVAQLHPDLADSLHARARRSFPQSRAKVLELREHLRLRGQPGRVPLERICDLGRRDGADGRGGDECFEVGDQAAHRLELAQAALVGCHRSDPEITPAAA